MWYKGHRKSKNARNTEESSVTTVRVGQRRMKAGKLGVNGAHASWRTKVALALHLLAKDEHWRGDQQGRELSLGLTRTSGVAGD